MVNPLSSPKGTIDAGCMRFDTSNNDAKSQAVAVQLMRQAAIAQIGPTRLEHLL